MLVNTPEMDHSRLTNDSKKRQKGFNNARNTNCMTIELQEIRDELESINGNPEYSIYLEGVRRFLKNWHRKSRNEIIDLCLKIKQSIEESFEVSLRLFGPRAVFFFDKLQPDQIS